MEFDPRLAPTTSIDAGAAAVELAEVGCGAAHPGAAGVNVNVAGIAA